MPGRRTGFSADLREKLLLGATCHCCLCKKACDIFIEVHHLIPEKDGGTDDEDNAIPLCFDCHSYSPQIDLRVGISIIDRYERSHRLLPVTWVYSWEIDEWPLDPVDPIASLRRDEARLGS